MPFLPKTSFWYYQYLDTQNQVKNVTFVNVALIHHIAVQLTPPPVVGGQTPLVNIWMQDKDINKDPDIVLTGAAASTFLSEFPTYVPPCSTAITLETNGVLNTIQTLLNLKQGTNVILVADAFGGVTISASGIVGTGFENISTGDNTTAVMTVDTGASLSYVGSGVVNANEIGGINVAGNAPAHAGEVLVSQIGDTSAEWEDPIGIVTLTAGQNIGAYQAVAVHADGLAYIADAGTLADADRFVGIAVTSALTGNTLQVQQSGTIDNVGFLFTPGTTIYLGLAGALTASPGLGLFELSLGVATSASQLEMQIGLVIVFA